MFFYTFRYEVPKEDHLLRAGISLDSSNVKKHIFTGDNALFYGLLNQFDVHDSLFEKGFDKLIQ